MAAEEVANIERTNDPVHKKKVHGKTGIKKESFREKMFRRTCLFRVIGTGDESSWKAS